MFGKILIRQCVQCCMQRGPVSSQLGLRISSRKFVTTRVNTRSSVERASFNSYLVSNRQVISAYKSSGFCAFSRTMSSTADVCDNIRLENRKMIAEILGVKFEDVTRTPSKKINVEKARRTYDVLKKFGFTSGSVLMYPDLLLMNGGAVENYIRIMKESCFPYVRETFILRFRTVCKQSLPTLQRKVSLPKIDVVVKHFCSELEEKKEFFDEVIKQLPSDSERITLFDLRCHVIGVYFNNKNLGSLEEVKATLKKYPRLYYRSFNWIKRTYKALTEFEFTPEKIKKHYYLLHADPDNLKRIYKINSLGGMELKKLAQSRPKVLMSLYETLIEIEKYLKDHNISFEAVQKYPELFTLSSKTIKSRLQEIDSIPEFQLLKTHPRVARLLYYHNKAKARLEEFRTMHVRVPSLHLLSADTKRFNKALSSGDLRIRGVDAMIYLAEVLKADKQHVREMVMRHPHWLHIPLISVKSTLKYIQGLGPFSDSQILDAITILLYPKNKVEKEVNAVVTSKEAQLTDPYFLHMVLYFLERPVHFTGDAVWQDGIARLGYESEDEGEKEYGHNQE